MKKLRLGFAVLLILTGLWACEKESATPATTAPVKKTEPADVYDPGNSLAIAKIDYTYPDHHITNRPLIYGQFTLLLNRLPDTSKIKSVIIYRDGVIKFVLNKTDKEFSDSLITRKVTYSYQIGYEITGYGYSKKSEPVKCSYDF